MTDRFELQEILYRAVYPPEIMPMFWKENGKISSAVFKDKNGLSVERGCNRTDKAVVDSMRLFFYGAIISVLVMDCVECNSLVRYLPSQRSRYHSEIHSSCDRKLLSQSQCKHLAEMARVVAL